MFRLFSVASVIVAIAAQAHAQPEAAPLSFEAALQAAQRASEAIAISRADVDRAQSQVTAARSGYFPTVNGSAAYQRTLASEFEDIMFTPPGTTPGEEIDLPFGQPNNWRLGIQVNQPLFDGFRTAAAVTQARAGVRVSELGVRSTRAQIVLQVAQSYYDAALAQRSVEIAEVTLQQAEATLAETELKFKQGAAPEFDLVRAQVARDNQSNSSVQFRVQRDIAFVQLRRLVGVPLDKPLTLTTQLEADDVDGMVGLARTAAGLPAGTGHIAIAQAKEGIAIRESLLDSARGERFPVVAAGSDFGLVNYENHPFNKDWRTNWTIGLTVSVPLFDGFRRSSNIKSSAAQLTAARAQLANATEASQVEAAQASASVAASMTTLETSTRTVGQARRAYQIAELRFQQGASSHLELVDARVQLEQALLNQARSARDVRVARLRRELLPGLPLGAAAGL